LATKTKKKKQKRGLQKEVEHYIDGGEQRRVLRGVKGSIKKGEKGRVREGS